jgi:hypothetical protein
MRLIATPLGLTKGRKLLALLGLAAALMAATAAPAKADGITVGGSSWQLYSKTCASYYYIANGRYESFCKELWRDDWYMTKEQQVDLFWDGATRCWRQYRVWIHYGLPNDGGRWTGPYAVPTYCYTG